MPCSHRPYSLAVKDDNTVYLSGQIGMNPASGELASAKVKEQTAQALKNMKAVLAASGATVDNVVKTTVFLRDMANFQAVNTVYAETFASDAPAHSCVAMAALSKGVHVEAIAAL